MPCSEMASAVAPSPPLRAQFLLASPQSPSFSDSDPTLPSVFSVRALGQPLPGALGERLGWFQFLVLLHFTSCFWLLPPCGWGRGRGRGATRSTLAHTSTGRGAEISRGAGLGTARTSLLYPPMASGLEQVLSHPLPGLCGGRYGAGRLPGQGSRARQAPASTSLRSTKRPAHGHVAQQLSAASAGS